jgi:hypothetical protein
MASIRSFRMLAHDSCARCSKDFKAKRGTALVVPINEELMPPPHIGIYVCETCNDKSTDRVIGTSIYIPAPGPRRPERWPVYYAPDGVPGFVKCARLDNGVVRIGLKRGHAEVWSQREVEAFGRTEPGRMAYSRTYGLYGPAEMFTPEGRHVVTAEHFINLAEPSMSPIQ